MSEIDKRVLVIDNGLFEHLAHRLAHDFSQVFYYKPWHGPAPTMSSRQIGAGYEDDDPPVLKVDPASSHPYATDVYTAIAASDLIVFPDVGDGDWQADLRRQGKRVWGCGAGELLETDRWRTRALLKKLGMPLTRAVRVVGLSALAELLRDSSDLYVKVSSMRGDMETFHHVEYRLTTAWLIKQRERWGAYVSEQMVFIVEEPIPGVEIGIDTWLVGGELPPLVSYGFEVKDASFIGRTCPAAALPECLRYVQESLAPWLASHYGPGFWSNEVRVGDDGKFYLTDPTCRLASPPGELYVDYWSNLGECMWHGSAGEMVAPVLADADAADDDSPPHLYGAELLLYSDFCNDRWMPIYVPEAIRRHVKLQFSTRGADPDTGEPCEYCVPQRLDWKKVGALVDTGPSMESAIANVRRLAQKGGLAGLDLDMHPEALDEAEAVVAKGQEYGIAFGDAADDDAPTEE